MCAALVNLVEQYKRGIRGHALLVLEELMHGYLEVEEQFHGDAFDKAVLALRQRLLAELELRTKRGSSTSVVAAAAQVNETGASGSQAELDVCVLECILLTHMPLSSCSFHFFVAHLLLTCTCITLINATKIERVLRLLAERADLEYYSL